MPDIVSVRGFFQTLVTDQLISRVVETGIGLVVAGPAGAVAVPLLSKAAEYYGPTVASCLWRWMNAQPSGDACATLEAVANLDPRTTLTLVDAIVESTAPNATAEAKNLAKSYLSSIPATLRQSLPRTTSGKSTCPAALLPRSEQDVFRLLPTFLPPYNAPCMLPATPYQLHELLGTGGFGAVYKATIAFEHEARVLKFCLDPERTAVLKLEKDRLDRLVSSEVGRDWPENIVRLIGHNLQHETPFLIFEYVPDGDLNVYVENLRLKNQRILSPDEVFALMRRLAAAVQSVHARGLTHRDLKPSNILFAGNTVKIADFGMGAVVPQPNRANTRQRSVSETTQEMRGGTWHYMSPEQKKNWKVVADSTQDIYSLGVLWYQLLLHDFSEEPGLSLERRLSELRVPGKQVELLKRCLDDRPSERPKNAGELVVLIDRVLRRADEEEEAARQAALKQKQAQDEAAQRAQEQADWSAAHEQGRASIQAYRQYLAKWPNGAHVSTAKQEIERLERMVEEFQQKFRRYGGAALACGLLGILLFGGLGWGIGFIGCATVAYCAFAGLMGALFGAMALGASGAWYSSYSSGHYDCCIYVMGPVNMETARNWAIAGAILGALCGVFIVGSEIASRGINVVSGTPNAHLWGWTAGQGGYWGSLSGGLIGLITGLILVAVNESD
jgi:serine/threonine protein kinase